MKAVRIMTRKGVLGDALYEGNTTVRKSSIGDLYQWRGMEFSTLLRALGERFVYSIWKMVWRALKQFFLDTLCRHLPYKGSVI